MPLLECSAIPFFPKIFPNLLVFLYPFNHLCSIKSSVSAFLWFNVVKLHVSLAECLWAQSNATELIFIQFLGIESVLQATGTRTLCTVYAMTSAVNGKINNTHSRNIHTLNYLCTDVFWDNSPNQIILTNNMETGSSQCVCTDASTL
jgi:hypothetical protein